MSAILRSCPLILILLAALPWSPVVEIARAAAPPFAMGAGDSWNGIHSFLVFAPEPEGNFTAAHMAGIARRYDFGWSPRHAKALIAGNPAFVMGIYYTSTQVDRDKEWIESNHPEWIVYKADRTTPVTQFDYKALTFDISNPEVVAYQFETMKKLANSPTRPEWPWPGTTATWTTPWARSASAARTGNGRRSSRAKAPTPRSTILRGPTP